MQNMLFGACLLCLSLGFCALAGCGAKETSQEPENDMSIVVDFTDVHRCSRISPEITVYNAPANTVFYDVRLIEESRQDRYLGGGVWHEDGSGIIPEGALTRHYTGPCPDKNQKGVFTYVVSAMETPEGQPLEVRLQRLQLE